jgi:hypothetical protein
MLFRQASIAFALWALAAPAFGQDVTNPTPPNSINGAYNASAPTCIDGHGCWLQTDVNGNLKVVTAGTPADVQAVSIASGGVASGAFASGSQPIGITPTDRTVTSATGSSQTVTSALATRKSLLIVNTGNANCGVNPTGGTAVIGGAGTITLTPTGSYSPRIPTLSAVTAICTAGQPLYAEES